MIVAVYKNLHKSKPNCPIYSIKDLKTGKVIAWEKEVYLSNVIFQVSEKGRQRVIREKKKYVHAYVIGNWKKLSKPISFITKVRYNPYETATFIKTNNKKPILKAKEAFLCSSGVWIN